MIGVAAQFRSMIRNPNRSSIACGLKFWRPELKTEYIGMSRKIWRIAGRQPESGLMPRSR
jgi:hypothetical protein